MDRPTLNSPIVIKKVAKKLLPLVDNWFDRDDEKGELLEQIEHAITLNDCGYEIAKFLENNYGFKPNSKLVNIFEDNTLFFKRYYLEQITSGIYVNLEDVSDE